MVLLQVFDMIEQFIILWNEILVFPPTGDNCAWSPAGDQSMSDNFFLKDGYGGKVWMLALFLR